MIDPKDFLPTVSSDPGVYLMHGSTENILYVGKARNLKKRLSSYFRQRIDDPKTQSLMQQVKHITITITASENDALLLEANLIKRHQPKYNILLRDDKSYPYMMLSTSHEFPKLDFHRGARRQKGRYFGPYPDSRSVRDTLLLIQKLFKLRQCTDSFFKFRKRPCLQYQINLCTAPCVGKVSKADYASQVSHAVQFLEGKSELVMDGLSQDMELASSNRDYEAAAVIRDRIRALRTLQNAQTMLRGDKNIDVHYLHTKHGSHAIAIVFIRAGRVIGQKVFFPTVPQGALPCDIVMGFLPQYYLSPLRGNVLLDELIISVPLPEKQWLASALQSVIKKITDRSGGKNKRWLLLAKKNAAYQLTQRLSSLQTATEKLSALQSALSLPNPISTIDCFDVSHTQGEATIAACVVFGQSGADNKAYRRFNITNITQGDDYQAISQAVYRRYKRLKEAEATLPDVVLIDGGKGQLAAVMKVFESLQLHGVELIAVAKGAGRKPGLEALYRAFPTVEPLVIEPQSMAMHLIQFVRDESHRFAISGHRQKRKKASFSSLIDAVDGVGAKKKSVLLKHFGGMRALRQASVEDIMRVPGISATLAQRIHDVLR